MKAGDKVRAISEKRHQLTPGWYPPVGTIGVVTDAESTYGVYVQWPAGSTSFDDLNWCEKSDVEVIEE